MGVSQNGWFIMENPHLEMDENWGYPYFRKPPYIYILHITYTVVINHTPIHPAFPGPSGPSHLLATATAFGSSPPGTYSQLEASRLGHRRPQLFEYHWRQLIHPGFFHESPKKVSIHGEIIHITYPLLI